MRRLLAYGLVLGGGAIFSFSTIGEFLATRAPGASVFTVGLGLLTALGYLSSQRLLRTQGVRHPWASNEILLTAGYGLMAACAPLASGFYSPQLNVGLDGASRWTWWPAALLVALICVALNVFVPSASRVAIAVVAFLALLAGIVLIGGVVAHGGFRGNHVRSLLPNGSSFSGVLAGVSVAVPFFFGSEAIITRSAGMDERDRSFSRPALITLGLLLIGLQYAGVTGSDGSGSLPIDIPALTGAYVSHGLTNSATVIVFLSSVGAAVLFAYLFASRLATMGVSPARQVGLLLAVTLLPVGLSMLASTSLEISSQTGTYAAMTLFLNLSAIAGLLLACGLAWGCLRALRYAVSQKLDSMELVPPICGLVGLSVAMYGYVWHRTTASTWSHPEWLLAISVLAVLASIASSRRLLRSQFVLD